jgi:hypothetical protein
MALMGNALIDSTYFNQNWDGDTVDSTKLENMINAVSSFFELFCNRPLKENSYTYVASEEDTDSGVYYVEKYTVFDGPNSNVFWLPTYPIDSVSYFEISGTEVTAMTGYVADTGYALYKNTGKIMYDYCYDYPYLKNVKVKWKGGYPSGSYEMEYLKYLCFLTIKDYLNAPDNMMLMEETIGQYSYKISPKDAITLQGLNVTVSNGLKKFRMEAFA